VVSRGEAGNFGVRQGSVDDDVGVRFGGSEHHRIGISSSHTRHPPLRAGRPRGGERSSSEPRASASVEQGDRPLRRYGARFPAQQGDRPLRRHGARFANVTSPGGATPDHGVQHLALFGVSVVASRGVTARRALRSDARRPHRDREPRPLRSVEPPTPRDREPGALRSLEPPTSRNPGLFG
jgi:hypothetical protein